ncbi:hypothetical protein BD779DRAFT_1793181 [Infundibulicybe gibba]|nr:hypothetical protein BD779DRAFT_1793181 [Infundibulicybe gibba]
MQPFLLLVPALCARFVYSAPATFVDFADEALSISVAGISGGTTTFVVEENAAFTDPAARVTSAGTATVTIVEDGSGLHFTADLNGAVVEESCSWDSASTSANCVAVAKASQTTVSASGVERMFLQTFDAAVTNAPSATNSGSGSTPTTNPSSGSTPTTNPSSSASASGDAKPNGAASNTPRYQWAVLLLGGMAGAFFVW